MLVYLFVYVKSFFKISRVYTSVCNVFSHVTKYLLRVDCDK